MHVHCSIIFSHSMTRYAGILRKKNNTAVHLRHQVYQIITSEWNDSVAGTGGSSPSLFCSCRVWEMMERARPVALEAAVAAAAAVVEGDAPEHRSRCCGSWTSQEEKRIKKDKDVPKITVAGESQRYSKCQNTLHKKMHRKISKDRKFRHRFLLRFFPFRPFQS